MSGVMESRAAVFTNEPQDVEIHVRGMWRPGAMLGWRHDAGGGCRAWVRLADDAGAGGLWIDLADVRLPECTPAVAPGPADVGSESAADPAPAPHLVAGAGSPGGRSSVAAIEWAPTSADPAATVGMPPLRDRAGWQAAHPAGRRRADRRVIGDTAEWSAVDQHGVPLPPAGRHRAPSTGTGRHRAADTDVWPVLVETPDGLLEPAGSDGALDSRALAPCATEPDRLTRPMRLGGAATRRRRPRRDDTLTGV